MWTLENTSRKHSGTWDAILLSWIGLTDVKVFFFLWDSCVKDKPVVLCLPLDSVPLGTPPPCGQKGKDRRRVAEARIAFCRPVSYSLMDRCLVQSESYLRHSSGLLLVHGKNVLALVFFDRQIVVLPFNRATTNKISAISCFFFFFYTTSYPL